MPAAAKCVYLRLNEFLAFFGLNYISHLHKHDICKLSAMLRLSMVVVVVDFVAIKCDNKYASMYDAMRVYAKRKVYI